MKKSLILCITMVFLLLVSNASALEIDQTLTLNKDLYNTTWNWTQSFTFNPGLVTINSASLTILANDVNLPDTTFPLGEIDTIRGDGSLLGTLVQGGVLTDSTTVFNFNSLLFGSLLDGSMDFNIVTDVGRGLTLKTSRLLIDYSVGGETPPPNNAVPEPMTLLLVGSGMLGLAGLKRKFRK